MLPSSPLDDARKTLPAPVQPPLAFFTILLGGVGLSRLLPLGFLPSDLSVRLGAGLPLFALALAIGVAAFRSFRRFRTSPQFGEPVTSLVATGPYRFSRNPLYVALVLVLLGFAALLDNAWLLVGALVLFVVLDRLVVRREEQFLASLFGADYATYRSKVRRWL